MARRGSYTILIAGLGALGTVFATLLKKAGHTVYAFAKEKYLPALSDGKLNVTGIWGEHTATIDGLSGSIDRLKGKNFDVIIVSVTSHDTKIIIDQVKSLVEEKTVSLRKARPLPCLPEDPFSIPGHGRCFSGLQPRPLFFWWDMQSEREYRDKHFCF